MEREPHVISLDAHKTEMRRAHFADDRAKLSGYAGMDLYRKTQEHAFEFFRQYEQVNRDFCPDDPVYSVVRAAVTPVAGNDLFTFLAVGARQWRLLELIIGSEALASAAHRVGWQTSTVGTTSGGALTPEKFNTNSPVSLFSTTSIVTTWAAQPTLSGNPKLVFAYNELGGFIDWKAAPGEEDYRSNEQVSFRNLAGTGVLSVTTIWEEL